MELVSEAPASLPQRQGCFGRRMKPFPLETGKMLYPALWSKGRTERPSSGFRTPPGSQERKSLMETITSEKKYTGSNWVATARVGGLLVSTLSPARPYSCAWLFFGGGVVTFVECQLINNENKEGNPTSMRIKRYLLVQMSWLTVARLQSEFIFLKMCSQQQETWGGNACPRVPQHMFLS